jgi:Leucine-rich repeat (LRR) protein
MKYLAVVMLLISIFVTASEKSWIPHYLESKNVLKKKYNEPLVSIQTNDQKTFKIPISLVQQMQTLKNLQEDIGAQDQIPVNQISSSQFRPVLALLESAQGHPQLRGQKLYDAMGKDVHINDGIEVLKAVNYLDIKPPLDKPVIGFLAKQIADEQDSPRWKPRRNIPLTEQLKDFGGAKIPYGALIARDYFLRTGKNLPNLPQEVLNHENYAFSIQGYLNNQLLRARLADRRVPGLDMAFFDRMQSRSFPQPGLQVPGPRGGDMYNRVIDLSQLNLNSLEGMENLQPTYHYSISETLTLYLDQNKLKNIELESFTGMPALQYIDLSNNKISEIDPAVFSSLNALKYLILRNNPLTYESKRGLLDTLPNVKISF